MCAIYTTISINAGCEEFLTDMADDKKVYGYTLRDSRHRIVDIGSTNSPRAREAEHRLQDKKFSYLKIETRPLSREKAEYWESRSVKGYKAARGRTPKYNRTPDGLFHPMSKSGQNKKKNGSPGTRAKASAKYRNTKAAKRSASFKLGGSRRRRR